MGWWLTPIPRRTTACVSCAKPRVCRYAAVWWLGKKGLLSYSSKSSCPHVPLADMIFYAPTTPRGHFAHWLPSILIRLGVIDAAADACICAR